MDPNDLLIEAEAERRMTRSLIPDLGSVMCHFRGGILTLNGVVSKTQDRDVAQELIEKIEGIEIIDNQLAVVSKEMPLALSKDVTPDDSAWPGYEEPVLLKIPGQDQAGPELTPAQTG
jgi:hypothetical protein